MPTVLKRSLKFWLNVVTILALTVLVIVSHKAIVEAFKKLGDLNAAALLLMIPLQALNYYSVARLYQDYFKSIGENLGLKKMYSVALELNFVNHVFPSGGVSGFSFLSLRLKHEGISTAKSTLAQILRFALTFVSFLILLFMGMLFLALQRHTSPLTILVASSVTFLTLFGVITVVFIISDERRIRSFTGFLPKALNKIARRLGRRERPLINVDKVENTMTDLHNDYVLLSRDIKSLKRPFGWAMLINLTDVLTIMAVYAAFGSLVNPGAVIIAYAVANFAGLVAILPGGVGIYEGLMTATLASAGVDKALALSATLVYRVLNMLYSLPIGYFLYQKTLRRAGGKMKVTNEEHRILDASDPNT